MDFAYYGNTVSSPLVLSALGGDHTVLQKTLTQLGIFTVFAAPGYAVAALTMDRIGRKTIQVLGFGMMAVTFGLLALIPNIEKADISVSDHLRPELLLYRIRSERHYLCLPVRNLSSAGSNNGS